MTTEPSDRELIFWQLEQARQALEDERADLERFNAKLDSYDLETYGLQVRCRALAAEVVKAETAYIAKLEAEPAEAG